MSLRLRREGKTAVGLAGGLPLSGLCLASGMVQTGRIDGVKCRQRHCERWVPPPCQRGTHQDALGVLREGKALGSVGDVDQAGQGGGVRTWQDEIGSSKGRPVMSGRVCRGLQWLPSAVAPPTTSGTGWKEGVEVICLPATCRALWMLSPRGVPFTFARVITAGQREGWARWWRRHWRVGPSERTHKCEHTVCSTQNDPWNARCADCQWAEAEELLDVPRHLACVCGGLADVAVLKLIEGLAAAGRAHKPHVGLQ